MTSGVCPSCHSFLRTRLIRRLTTLHDHRRGLHFTTSNLTLSLPKTHSVYLDTSPPTPQNLAAASSFFLTHPPRKLWTATQWRQQNKPESSSSAGLLIPEIVFLGRSNVGKSSLLNALLYSPNLNHVGSRPGKTRVMHAWGLGPSNPRTGGAVRGMGGDLAVKMAVLDMPGYGYGSHSAWGEEIITYLRRRKQLKRAFLLLHVGHSVKSADRQLVDLLRQEAIPHQIVASKCDTIKDAALLKKTIDLLGVYFQQGSNDRHLATLRDIIAVGGVGDGRQNNNVKRNDMIGIEELQWAVLRAAGLDEYAMDRLRPRSKPNAPLAAAAHESSPKTPSLKNMTQNVPAVSPLSGRNPDPQPLKPCSVPRDSWGPKVGGMAELLSLSQRREKRPPQRAGAVGLPDDAVSRTPGRKRPRRIRTPA